MKNTPLVILILLFLALLSTGCPGRGQQSQEPEYEKIIPPMDEGFNVESESASVVPVDIAPYEQAVNADPENPDARFSYMVELRTAGMIKEALEQAKILADMEGENPYKSIAEINIAEMVLDDLPSDDPDRPALVQDAMDRLWIALGYEPESVPAHLMLGRLALEAGDNEKALHHLAIALTGTEIGYELRMKMAEIYISEGETDKAREHLEVAKGLAEEAGDNQAVSEINRMLGNL
jgi:tetratricopeptide (TPR) repeat protein